MPGSLVGVVSAVPFSEEPRAGKCAGVMAATWLAQRAIQASLGEGVSWWDVPGLSLLAGIGFTVSLLIGELAFGAGSEKDEHARLGILAGSLIAALLAAMVLRARNRHYQRLCASEEIDTDTDGVPDVYEQNSGAAALNS